MADRNFAEFGTIIRGTLRLEDLAPAFLAELDFQIRRHNWEGEADTRDTFKAAADRIRLEIDFQFSFENPAESDPAGFQLSADDDTLSECVDELCEMLEHFAPPYGYFGAHEGDGSDFGYWVSWNSISDLESFEDFPDTLPDDDFTVASDHGNTTLYSADGREIWAVV